MPTEFSSCLRWIGNKEIDLSRPEKTRIDHYVVVHIEVEKAEGELTEFADGVGVSRPDYIVARFVLLKHCPT